MNSGVEGRKEGGGGTSQRGENSQDGRAVLDAMVWSAPVGEGLEHDETSAPVVPGPDDLPSVQDLLPPDAQPPFPFWLNFDAKPIDFEVDWPPEGPRPARWREGLRFLPTSVRKGVV